jgi:hypothetical protein
LTGRAKIPIPLATSVGRTAAPASTERSFGEESPGSIDMRCRITSGGGDPRESATENEPPAAALRGLGEARVKRCGKSAPRLRQRNRHGKPHREQDRIGTAQAGSSRKRQRPRSDVRLAVRVGCSRSRASAIPEEWPSRIAPRKRCGALQNPAYRPADASTHEGFGADRAGPLAISRSICVRTGMSYSAADRRVNSVACRSNSER